MNSFQLFFWPHRLMLVGPAIETRAHQHHAGQFAVGLNGQVAFRNPLTGRREEGACAWIQPDEPHALLASNSPCVLVYTDPESSECQQASAWFDQRSGVRPGLNPQLQEALQCLQAGPISSQQAEAFVRLLPWYRKRQLRRLDPRLERALCYLGQQMDGGDVSLEQVAKASYASESWMSHAFTEALGVPVRRFVVWLRLRAAVAAALEGKTLTEAAILAGFSDSAHFNRAFNQAFGVNPSFLLGPQAPVEVQLLE